MRSSLTRARPAAIASDGPLNGPRGGPPPTERRPVTRLRAAPKSELTSAVRPAPMSPPMPSTSPWRTSKSTLCSTWRPGFTGSSTDQPSTFSSDVPAAWVGRG